MDTPFVKDIIIRTAKGGSKSLTREAHIVFTLSPQPNEHHEQHYHELVWKVVTFNKHQDSEARIRWHSSFGFMWPQQHDGNSIVASSCVALEKGYSSTLLGDNHDGCYWSNSAKLTDRTKTESYEMLNKTGRPQSVVFGTVSSHDPLIVEPAVLFHDIPEAYTVEIGPLVILRAYFLQDHPHSAPARVWLKEDVDNLGPAIPLTTGNDGALNVPYLQNQTRYYLYTDPGTQSLKLEKDYILVGSQEFREPDN